MIEENNLQFVEHNVEEIIKEDSINVIFNIYEGEKNLVERINITGNYVTDENVIRGELILDEETLTEIILENRFQISKQEDYLKK